MKSDYRKDRHYVECSCGDPQHLLIFDLYVNEDNIIDIGLYLTSSWKEPLLNRIKQAFKFIFKHEPFLWSDSVVMTNANIHQLEEIIEKIKEVKNYES